MIPDSQSETKPKSKSDKAAIYLYIATALSSWGDRVWYFAVGIYFISLNPDDLRGVAIYGVMRNVAVIMFGTTVGDWIDKTPRLYALRTVLYIQNLTLATMAGIVVIALFYQQHFSWYWTWLIEGVLILLGAMAVLASMASKIAISKDWVPTIYGVDQGVLATTNAILRRIDLLSDVFGPIVTGIIMSFVSRWFSALFIALWNAISLVIELYLYTQVYRLAEEKLSKKNIDPLKKQPSGLSKLFASIKGLKTYRSLSVFIPGLSLALLYLTVLSFDSVTRAYIIEQKLSEAILGVCNAVGSVFGIVGTLVYPILVKRIGLVRTGVIGFWSEFAVLVICLMSLFTPGTLFEPFGFSMNPCPSAISPRENYTKPVSTKDYNNITAYFCSYDKLSVILLVVGIALNRFGLWTADLTVNQLQQERIPANIRGSMGGTQQALNQVFDMFRYALIVALPAIPQFGYHITISVCSVFTASLMYSLWSCSTLSQFVPPARDVEMAELPHEASKEEDETDESLNFTGIEDKN